MDFMLGEKKKFFFFTDHKSRACRKAMPAVTVSTMYVNYFVSLNSRLFGAYRLQLLPGLSYGTIKVGEDLNILTIL
jgi:hypothetical protein